MKEYKSNTKSKLIELPVAVIKRLEKKAKLSGVKLKPYMQNVLISHSDPSHEPKLYLEGE
jgi:hypothetical protein